MEELKNILIRTGLAVLILIPLLLSFAIGLHRGRKQAQKAIITDTVTVDHFDTITVLQPVSEVRRVVDTMWITVPAIRDTIVKAQTIPLPKEQVFYHDSTYEAWVSGYRPALDSIRVFRHNQTVYVDRVTEVKKQAHWGIGIQAGYGAADGPNGVTLTPFIGVGISYNILTW